MVRPKKHRFVKFDPNISYFKPRGIPMQNLKEVRLTIDEGEAIRLADLLGISHEKAGHRMGVSRATFGRIVQKARKTVADALINGKAINIEGGNYKIIMEARIFECRRCNNRWEEPQGAGRPAKCPQCNHDDFHRTVESG
jgi:predicted DNA-binding protein (UPF0251 family)